MNINLKFKMKEESFKNGFMIINGGKIESLPENLIDVPSKGREEEIIKQMIEELKMLIDDKIKKL